MSDPLLDPGAIAPARFEQLGRLVATLLETSLDIVLPQAEAVLPLEAAARGLGRAGLTVLNLETTPYGATIGRWLRQTGATVIGLEAEPRRAVEPEAVARALRDNPGILLVSFVHVEAASGVRNDAPAIISLAREHGALVLIDVVASTGAHEVALDDWGVDIAVVGPQKALAGPAGISVAAVSDRAWLAMSDNPGAPRDSVLSLLDWKERWLDTDHSVIPGTPVPLEILALEAALERVSAEGLANVQRRHRCSAAASRAGARALGLSPYALDPEAAVVATTLQAPPGTDARALVERARRNGVVALSPGFGALAGTVLRIDHTGQRARLDVVLGTLEALGGALDASPGRGSVPDALEAAQQAWSAEETRSPA
ncbi:MAG: aminotransferase class V-fold PLP-dependent enzyme [Acidimicrobiales bacterium]|jgi:aspartate aminotransferase-like enzyme